MDDGAHNTDRPWCDAEQPKVATGVLAEATRTNNRCFLCCGQHGSGSTSMFNLVREISRTQGVDFVSCHPECSAKLPLDDLGSRLLAVKLHNPMADLLPLITNSGEPAVITVREPRVSVTSFMQRFAESQATTFDVALKTIALSAQRLVSLWHIRKIPVFCNEDGFVASLQTFAGSPRSLILARCDGLPYGDIGRGYQQSNSRSAVSKQPAPFNLRQFGTGRSVGTPTKLATARSANSRTSSAQSSKMRSSGRCENTVTPSGTM